jgi:hypothetical protein
MTQGTAQSDCDFTKLDEVLRATVGHDRLGDHGASRVLETDCYLFLADLMPDDPSSASWRTVKEDPWTLKKGTQPAGTSSASTKGSTGPSPSSRLVMETVPCMASVLEDRT